MISVDFAPNEAWDDAVLSLKLLFQPWKWKNGEEIEKIKNETINVVRADPRVGPLNTHLFLTGRAALYHYLKVLDLPADSEVIIQAFTCAAVPLPIIANNLKPIYVDIESETFSMNIEDLEKKYTNKAKVLILQHTFGFTPKFQKEILQFAKQHNLHILIDLAHGFDKEVFNETMKQCDNVSMLLSFGRSKAFSSVFGGALVTTDKQLSEKLNEVEQSLPPPSIMFIFRCLLYKPIAMIIKSTYDIYLGKLFHKVLTIFNILIPEITSKEKKGNYDELLAKAYPNALAILLLHQLNKYEKTKQKRIESVKIYNGHFKINYPLQPVIRYPLLIDNRDDVMKQAAGKNIYLGKWYDQVIGPKPVSLEKMSYTNNSCLNAEKITDIIINLPIEPSKLHLIASSIIK